MRNIISIITLAIVLNACKSAGPAGEKAGDALTFNDVKISFDLDKGKLGGGGALVFTSTAKAPATDDKTKVNLELRSVCSLPLAVTVTGDKKALEKKMGEMTSFIKTAACAKGEKCVSKTLEIPIAHVKTNATESELEPATTVKVTDLMAAFTATELTVKGKDGGKDAKVLAFVSPTSQAFILEPTKKAKKPLKAVVTLAQNAAKAGEVTGNPVCKGIDTLPVQIAK